MSDTLLTPLPREISVSRTSGAFVPIDVRARARRCIADMVAQGSQALGIPVFMPTCSFDLRGSTAGRSQAACSGRMLVKSNVQLNGQLMLTHESEQCDVTIPHEVAHHLTTQRFGPKVKAHGPEWKAVMRLLGQKPERTHSMDAPPARVVARDHVYQCGCKVHRLTGIRHKKIRRGTRYSCAGCGQTLVYRGNAQGAGAPHAAETTQRPPLAPLPARPTATPLPRDSFVVPRPLPAVKQACPVVLTPTEKQLAYAGDVARRQGLSIPSSVRYDREQLSRWIAQHA